MKPLKRREPGESYLSKVTLLDRRQVCSLLGISAWTLNRWVRCGRFPKPVRLSDSTHRWALVDVEIWLQRQKRQQRPAVRLRGKAAMWGKPKPRRIERVRL
jgi:predicted DNA-binding transcriptional regulator AlpA